MHCLARVSSLGLFVSMGRVHSLCTASLPQQLCLFKCIALRQIELDILGNLCYNLETKCRHAAVVKEPGLTMRNELGLS